MQRISISFEDRYNVKKTVVTSFAKVSNVKRISQDKRTSQNCERFLDLSVKPARATIWRQLEARFRNKRAKMLPFWGKVPQKTGVNKTKKRLEGPLTLNSQAMNILKDIKEIHK